MPFLSWALTLLIAGIGTAIAGTMISGSQASPNAPVDRSQQGIQGLLEGALSGVFPELDLVPRAYPSLAISIASAVLLAVSGAIWLALADITGIGATIAGLIFLVAGGVLLMWLAIWSAPPGGQPATPFLPFLHLLTAMLGVAAFILSIVGAFQVAMAPVAPGFSALAAINMLVAAALLPLSFL